MRLTDRRIRTLSPGEYHDDDVVGLSLRVSAQTGRRTFHLRYRSGRARRRMQLGLYPAVKLAAARKRATSILGDVADGGDPAAERTARQNAETFGELCDLYMERHAKVAKRSWREDLRIIDRELRPAWGSWKVADVRRVDVLDLRDVIVHRGAPVMANRTRALISKMFAFAVDREIVESNPAYRVKPIAEQSRSRVLGEQEVRDFWTWAGELSPLMGAHLRLRLLTGQRGIEVLSMRWSDIDGEWWTIPASVAKNGREHRVPLSPQALRIIDAIRPSDADGSGWVFPSGPGHLRYTNKAVQRLRSRHAFDWTPHDLRRTCATFLTTMGIAQLVVSKVLNHAERGVTSIYDRSSYDAEKRRALVLWGDRVERIVSGRDQDDKIAGRIGA